MKSLHSIEDTKEEKKKSKIKVKLQTKIIVYVPKISHMRHKKMKHMNEIGMIGGPFALLTRY